MYYIFLLLFVTVPSFAWQSERRITPQPVVHAIKSVCAWIVELPAAKLLHCAAQITDVHKIQACRKELCKDWDFRPIYRQLHHLSCQNSLSLRDAKPQSNEPSF